jgi:hypothetical protein
MAQAVSRQPLTAEVQVSPCRIYGGQSGTGTVPSSKFFGFLLSISFHQAPHQTQHEDHPCPGKEKVIC